MDKDRIGMQAKKPFLLLQSRSEDEASDDEYQAFLKFGGLKPAELTRLRLDMGMRAITPAYQSQQEHYAIFHPNFGRDFSFHFAVGLPF